MDKYSEQIAASRFAINYNMNREQQLDNRKLNILVLSLTVLLIFISLFSFFEDNFLKSLIVVIFPPLLIYSTYSHYKEQKILAREINHQRELYNHLLKKREIVNHIFFI